MGTKQQIADEVSGVLAEVRPGRPILDLFCGMCSVAGAVSGTDRQVWGNDIQRFAAHAARCVIATPSPPPDSAQTSSMLSRTAARNAAALESRFASQLAVEQAVLAQPTVEEYQRAYRAWKHVGNDRQLAQEARGLRSTRRAVPYRLVTLTFAWGYFGLRQAITIDSLRYAIDRHSRTGDLSLNDRRWALLALLQAASRLAASPGHLAQYLTARNESSLTRVVRQRRRSIQTQLQIELDSLSPYGTAPWRQGNAVMCRDASTIWRELAARNFRGNVIYADPPYSKNQYSRFYHVLETLHRYDYPPAAGRGRYRFDRHATGFSERGRVAKSFEDLCAGAARLNCALVLSYPTNGLLTRYGKGDLPAILARHFKVVRLAMIAPSTHSTLGSAHGTRHNTVEELLYVAVPE